jgi:alkylation response protein AidB-like acyl-CoA dehydrogenase
VNGTDILAGVTALAPEVRARADEIAAGRRLPDDLVDALKAAGAFRMPMPRAWGGPEMTPAEQLRVVETLAEADPSAAWCVMIGSDAGFYSAFLDDGAGRGLFPHLDSIVAGWLMPAGRAEVVDGGYRVSGRWAFGSCSLHADVLVGGCLVFDGDEMRMAANGLPEVRIAMAPAEHWTILDTWYTTGLAGSGSNDYEVDGLVVPEERTFTLLDPPRRTGPLYAFPGLFFANIHGVPLGLARRAVDEVKAIAAEKVLMPELQAMHESPRVRSEMARAELALGAARAHSYAVLDEVWADLEAGRALSLERRADLALSRLGAFRMAREVTQAMVDLAGTQAIYATSPLDRLLRDAITMSQHIVAQDRMLEMAGALTLGGDTGLPFI